jgi:hypothetical protein
MIRILTAAAAVAALIASPAAAKSIHVPVAGKSVEQVRADVAKAAKTVCFHATANATFPQQEMAACMKATVASAMAQLDKSAQLAASN